MNSFQKSDQGAQAAWKGFSSQTLYIASRLISDKDGYEYYPEDVEDLVIKKNNVVIEAVQVKNISASLTLSSLAGTKTSQSGEGFFNRMCSLHEQYPSFNNVNVVYFNSLGTELQEIQEGNANTKRTIIKKLVDDHGLCEEDAIWLIDSLHFEKVNLNDLDSNIQNQITNYVPVMSAPTLAKELLIQHISVLSKSKGYTTLQLWEEKIHEIGTNIASLDGFYKEYNKSLVRLDEFKLNDDYVHLQKEYSQGIAAHPSHIRNNLDFKRNYWMEEIQSVIDTKGVAIVKGVSGQGKSTLCYRYLMDTYPEGCVFCVRTLANEGQAQNLVSALDGLGKHNESLIIYIDVQPGETLWAFLLQELQVRGLSIPVLISIRDEDYNQTPISGKQIKYGIVELTLTKEEAEQIYNTYTETKPHQEHRTFEEAWEIFGGQGPLIEFTYFITHNQVLAQRLHEQLDALLQQRISDEWLELLQIVCYVGRLGCSINITDIKNEIHCSNIYAAIRRLQDEYLIKVVDENTIEALHPVRAKIIFDVLCNLIYTSSKEIVFKALPCIESKNIRVVLLDYFSNNQYDIKDIQRLSQIEFCDWVGYANSIRTMLWLDAKCYVESNMKVFESLVAKHGKWWLCLLPVDLSGIYGPDKMIADDIKELPKINKTNIQNDIDNVKKSLTSLHIDYQVTDYFINNSKIPPVLPDTDSDCQSFGYSLFWMAKRNREVILPFEMVEIVTSVCKGDLQSSADAIRGLSEHTALQESYLAAVDVLVKRLINEMQLLNFSVTDDVVTCKFIPPLLKEVNESDNIQNFNQYWRIKMLDILKQLYPEKEYIDIELIGVDLLRDLGIEALDDKLHIHKSKRLETWVTEVNGWAKIRIEYSFRPSSWQEYVTKLDELRINTNNLVVETIKLFNDIYKKGRYTEQRGKKIVNLIELFKEKLLNENLLPYFAVDPYCLYSEGNDKSPDAEYYPMRQLLSVKKYDNFRKCHNDLYRSLDNFYDQFFDVFSVRLKRQDINTIDNPRIAMFNLYAASKNLVNFQKEYDLLFSEYSTLNGDFSKHELENAMTLVNVWRYMLDNQPKNHDIAYDAKQKYRKGTNYFSDNLSIAVKALDGKLLTGDKHTYIIVNYNMNNDITLEDEYTRIVMTIRHYFQDSILPSSNRWYLETQSLELAYVPAFNGVISPSVFSIPTYKLLDVEESQIAKPMFPCDKEPVLMERINASKSLRIWNNAMEKIGVMKVYLQRYMQILQVPVDQKCLCTLTRHIEELINQISALWNDIILIDNVVNELFGDVDEQNIELLNIIKQFLDCYEEIESIIRKHNDLSESIRIIEDVMVIMIYLLPLVAKLPE